MKELTKKYEVKTNIKGFNGALFNIREEAEIHILEDLSWIKDKPKYSHLKHKIKEIQVEVNPIKEIFKYFLDC